MYNYHIHTYRCKHAKGEIDEYAYEAKKKGLKSIGFTDHTPLPDRFTQFMRMDIQELDDYSKKIENEKNKYINIEIYKGLECEYDKKYINFYKEIKEKYKLDYLICGQHFFKCKDNPIFYLDKPFMGKQEVIAYTKYVIKAIDSGLFSFIAHPDLFGLFYKDWDKETEVCSKAIVEAAKDNNILLEINTQGWFKNKILTNRGYRSPYPLDKFWEIASDYNIKAIINTDAHTLARIDDGIVRGYEYASNFNIEIGIIKL